MVTRDTFARIIARAGAGAVLFALFATIAAPARALGQQATQVVTFRVEGIDQISFDGAPNLSITTATAGQSPASVTASGGSWSVTTNRDGTRITASVDSELPSGLTLSVRLGAPTGAASAGFRALGTTPVDVVTDLSKTAQRGLPVTYQLDALVTAGRVVAGTRTVVFTITGGI